MRGRFEGTSIGATYARASASPEDAITFGLP
jgi:hypothetical protein